MVKSREKFMEMENSMMIEQAKCSSLSQKYHPLPKGIQNLTTGPHIIMGAILIMLGNYSMMKIQFIQVPLLTPQKNCRQTDL
jgi:hypothetical protein